MCASSRRALSGSPLFFDPLHWHRQKDRYQFIEVRPRATIDRAPSFTAPSDARLTGDLELARIRFLSAAGTANHAWWPPRTRCGRAAKAVRALSSLCGCCGRRSTKRSRVPVLVRGECGEAAEAGLQVVAAMEACDERHSLVARHPGLNSHGLGWQGKARVSAQEAWK